MRNPHFNSTGGLAFRRPPRNGLRYRRDVVVLQRALQPERLKAVTNSEYRFNILLAISAQLLPQAPDMHIERPRPDLRAVAPDSPQQRFAGNDLARVLHQKRQ